MSYQERQTEYNKKISLCFVVFTFICGALTMFFPEGMINYALLLMQLVGICGMALTIYRQLDMNPTVIVFTIGAGLAVVHSLMNGSGFGSVILIVEWFLIFLFSSYMSFDKKYLRILDLVTVLVLLALIIIYNEQGALLFYVNRFNPDNRKNPNNMALVFFAFGVMLDVTLRDFFDGTHIYRSIRAIFYLFVFAVVMLLIKKSGARGSMIAWAVYNFVLLIGVIVKNCADSKKREVKNRYPLFIVIALICAIGFTAVYIALYKVLGSDFTILGKKLFSGRQNVWIDAYVMLSKDFNIITGFSNEFLFSGVWKNAHNGILAILCYFGIVPFVAFVAMFAFGVSGRNVGKTFSLDIMKVSAMFAFIALCTFESFILDTAFWWLMLPCFINKREVSENDTKEDTLLLVWEKPKAKYRKKLYQKLERKMSRV